MDEFNPVSLCHSSACMAEINLSSYTPQKSIQSHTQTLMPVQAGVTLWREKKKHCVRKKRERMREEEICVGHKGIKGQLNNSGHIFQAGGGVL